MLTFAKNSLRTALIAAATTSLFAGAAVAAPAANAAEPSTVSAGCKVTQSHFNDYGVDVTAYDTPDELLQATLDAVSYTEGKVGAKVQLNWWTARVGEATSCGFVTDPSAPQPEDTPTEKPTPKPTEKPADKPADKPSTPAEEEPALKPLCKLNKSQFSAHGVDLDDYTTDSALRTAILDAVNYQRGETGSAVLRNVWEDRLNKAVDCGFVTTDVPKLNKPGLNAIVPCGTLDDALRNSGIDTAEYNHAELSKKLRRTNMSEEPIGKLIGAEYFDDIADRAQDCGLVTATPRGSLAGSSKGFDQAAAGADLMSSLSSKDGDPDKPASSGDDLQTGVIVGGVIAAILALFGIGSVVGPQLVKLLPPQLAGLLPH